MNWYRAGLPRMALNGRLTSATPKRTLSVRKFSAVLNVIGREIQLHGVTDTGLTPENRHYGWSFPICICNFLKAASLMRLRAAPPSTKTWYSLTLKMVGETSSGSCPTPAMLLGQSEESNPIGVSTHLRCGATCGAGATAATSQHRVLMTRLDVMAQEPPNMTWSISRRSLSLDLESEWPYTAFSALLAS
jgi:hypothetical protein